jgi:transcriptional regulator with XRE-family HTH domain
MRRTNPRRAKFYERPSYLAIIGRIATNVRRLREARGWSQAELAFRADEMEVVALQGIERGASNTTVVTIARLCDALSIDVRELMEPAPPPPKRPRGRPRKNG